MRGLLAACGARAQARRYVTPSAPPQIVRAPVEELNKDLDEVDALLATAEVGAEAGPDSEPPVATSGIRWRVPKRLLV